MVIVYPAQDSPRQAKLGCRAMSVAAEATYGTSQPGDEVFIAAADELQAYWGHMPIGFDQDGEVCKDA
jgi:hypothetical protein